MSVRERKCVCISVGLGIELGGARTYDINVVSLKETINFPRAKGTTCHPQYLAWSWVSNMSSVNRT